MCRTIGIYRCSNEWFVIDSGKFSLCLIRKAQMMVFNLFNTELSLYFFACWSQAGEWVGQPMWFPIYKACFRGGNLFHQHHTRTPRTPRNWSTVCFTQHLDIHVAYVCNSQSLMLAGEIQSLLVSMGDGHTEANIINELKQWPCWLFTFNFSSLLSWIFTLGFVSDILKFKAC